MNFAAAKLKPLCTAALRAITLPLFVTLVSPSVFTNYSLAQSTEEKNSPLSLDFCLKLALKNNHDLQLAREQIEKQYQVSIQANSPFFPSVDFLSNVDFIDKERLPELNQQRFGNDKNWNSDLQLSYKIYSGGRDNANLSRAKLNEEAARAALDSAILTTLLAVKEAYYSLVLAKSNFEVEQQNLDLVEEQLRSEKRRSEAGVVAEFNILRAEVEVANAKAPYIRSKNAIRLAWEELRRVLGFGEQSEQDLVEPRELSDKLEFDPAIIPIEEALKSARAHRPELRRDELLIEAEGQNIEANKAGYRPELTVFGAYGAEKSRFSDEFNEEIHGWKAGGTLRWNLFNGFLTDAQVSEARIGEQQARTKLRKTKQDVDVEVRAAHSKLQEAVELVNASNKVVEQATESLRLAKARYENGIATYLDTLETRVALTRARTNQLSALYDYNISKAKLDRALGK